MISANGGAPVRAICFDSGSFSSVEYKEVLISLNAGENSLRFQFGWICRTLTILRLRRLRLRNEAILFSKEGV